MRHFVVLVGLVMFYGGGCLMPNPPAGKPKPDGNLMVAFFGYGDSLFSGGLKSYAPLGYERVFFNADQIDAAIRYVEAANPKRLSIIGHSFGGGAGVRLAQELANRERGVRLLVVLDGSQPRNPGGDFTQAIPIEMAVPRSVEDLLVVCNPTTPIPWPGPAAPCPRLNWAFGVHEEIQTTTVNHLDIDDNGAIRSYVVSKMEEVAQ